MVEKCKYQRIGKKPAETHYAEGWFRFIIKALFLHGYANEKHTYQSQYNAGRGVQTGRIVKRVDGEAQYKSKDEQHHIGCFER